jgi:hypothetical protein
VQHGGVLVPAGMRADAKNGGAREAAWCSGEVQAGTGRNRSTTPVGQKSKTRQSIRMRAQMSIRGHEAKGRQTDAARARCWCRGREEDWAGRVS